MLKSSRPLTRLPPSPPPPLKITIQRLPFSILVHNASNRDYTVHVFCIIGSINKRNMMALFMHRNCVYYTLRHWGREKCQPFSRQHFQMDFFKTKCIILIKISLKFVPSGSINNIPALVPDNGLAPVRRQAIIWTNDGLDYWHKYASLGLNVLTNCTIISSSTHKAGLLQGSPSWCSWMMRSSSTTLSTKSLASSSFIHHTSWNFFASVAMKCLQGHHIV